MLGLQLGKRHGEAGRTPAIEGEYGILQEYRSECRLGTDSVPLGRIGDGDDGMQSVVGVDVVAIATTTRVGYGAVQREYSIICWPFSIMSIPPQMVGLG